MPDQYAVIGNPVAHSKSPLIHAAFARQTGQDLVYGRLLANEGAFVATANAFRAGGVRGTPIRDHVNRGRRRLGRTREPL